MSPIKCRNPVPTVDIIIEVGPRGKARAIVLVKRKNPPFGWALPGGFVDYGESLEEAAVREAREETSLEVELLGQLHSYSDPGRDPRLHTISTVFIARAGGAPEAADDALEARLFDPTRIRVSLAFDHRKILDDYLAFKEGRFPWTRRKTGTKRAGRMKKELKKEL
jgi:8-oxo-dGTP diphosphatase